MYIHEAIYDIDELVRENLHIHTEFSGCAKREMTIENILETAKKTQLKMIALTDHHHPATTDLFDKVEEWFKNRKKRKNNEPVTYLEKVAYIRKKVEEQDLPFKVLVGAELSSYDIGKFSDTDEENAALDYRLYACNHYHTHAWGQPKEKSIDSYVRHCLDNIEALLKSNRADCIAHPFTGRYLLKRISELEGDPCKFSAAITDNQIADIMEMSKISETAWELNLPSVLGEPDFHRRFFNIGREVGAVFSMGTDAHKLEAVDPAVHTDELKKILL